MLGKSLFSTSVAGVPFTVLPAIKRERIWQDFQPGICSNLPELFLCPSCVGTHTSPHTCIHGLRTFPEEIDQIYCKDHILFPKVVPKTYQSMLWVDVWTDHDSLWTLQLIQKCLHQSDSLSVTGKVKWGQIVLNSEQVKLQVGVEICKVVQQVLIVLVAHAFQEAPCRDNKANCLATVTIDEWKITLQFQTQRVSDRQLGLVP